MGLERVRSCSCGWSHGGVEVAQGRGLPLERENMQSRSWVWALGCAPVGDRQWMPLRGQQVHQESPQNSWIGLNVLSISHHRLVIQSSLAHGALLSPLLSSLLPSDFLFPQTGVRFSRVTLASLFQSRESSARGPDKSERGERRHPKGRERAEDVRHETVERAT